jgi:GLPGLI family protein
MKKIVLLILVNFFIVGFCLGQENGVVTYSVSHNWIKKFASCEYIPKADRERYLYTWGGAKEYVENAELKFNANAYRYEIKGNESTYTYKWREDVYIIYRDREIGETFDVIEMFEKKYLIQDSITCQSWKIKNDMREIAGHICMNALYYDTIKGKEVIAWFALDLPVPIGPNQYCGLPGMILEINEANGALVYTATNVLLSNETVEVPKPVVKNKIKVINYSEYDKKIIDYIKECKKLQRPYFWGGMNF